MDYKREPILPAKLKYIYTVKDGEEKSNRDTEKKDTRNISVCAEYRGKNITVPYAGFTKNS